MHQTVHVFKKDVHQFWKEISLVMATTILFTAVGLRRATQPQHLEMAWSFSIILLPISWWLLISRVVHAEALPGSREFWMTRPYSWRSLLASKAVFVLVFINIPTFIADALIVERYGFRFAEVLPGLISKQAMISAAFLVPSAVLAALTTGLVQELLTLVALAVSFVVFVWWTSGGGLFAGRFNPFDWLRWFLCGALAAIAGLAIIVLQYRRRRTRVSATLSLLCLLGVGFVSVRTPWLWILEVQSKLSKQYIPASEVAVRLDSGYPAHALFLRDDQVEIDVPIELASPPNLGARIESLGFYIKARDGRSLPFFSPFPGETTPNQGDTTPNLQATVPGWFYQEIKDAPLKIQGRAYITLFSRAALTRILPGQMQAAVPEGRCSASSSDDGKIYFLSCALALHSDRERKTVRMQVAVDGRTETLVPSDQFQAISYSMFPADFDLDPINRREYMAQLHFWERDELQSGQPALKSIEVITSAPVAHLWSNFEITGPRLSEHEVNMFGPLWRQFKKSD